MKDIHGTEIRAGDKVVHTTPSGGGRGQALRFGTVKSVREKTCTVTALEIRWHYNHDTEPATVEKYEKPVDRICRREERVMVIERNNIYLKNHPVII